MNRLIFLSRVIAVSLAVTFMAKTGFATTSSASAFISGSLSEILSVREGKPLMVVLWSIDCPSCLRELGLLKEFRRKYKHPDFVLISTDDISLQSDIRQVLENQGLDDIESWAFADGNAQRLRYEIDPKWYGEIPRTYFYDAQHNRAGLSGALTARHIEAWLSTISAKENLNP